MNITVGMKCKCLPGFCDSGASSYAMRSEDVQESIENGVVVSVNPKKRLFTVEIAVRGGKFRETYNEVDIERKVFFNGKRK